AQLVEAGDDESRDADGDHQGGAGFPEGAPAISTASEPPSTSRNAPRAGLVLPGVAESPTSPVASHAPAKRPSAVAATVSRARKLSTAEGSSSGTTNPSRTSATVS